MGPCKDVFRSKVWKSRYEGDDSGKEEDVKSRVDCFWDWLYSDRSGNSLYSLCAVPGNHAGQKYRSNGEEEGLEPVLVSTQYLGDKLLDLNIRRDVDHCGSKSTPAVIESCWREGVQDTICRIGEATFNVACKGPALADRSSAGAAAEPQPHICSAWLDYLGTVLFRYQYASKNRFSIFSW